MKSKKHLPKAGLLLCAIALSGCSHVIGGQYFTSSQAMKPIKTNGKVYQPHIIPIDNKLYTSTIAYDRKHPKQSLWYSNDYLYRIGAEDVLRITVWDHPELNDPSTNTPINYNPAGSTATNPLSNRGSSNPIGTTVDAEGNIYYPFAGQVHLAGLTPRAASVVLSKKLSGKIRNPQVSINVTNYRSQRIQVIGAVGRPQTVSLADVPLTILDAITQAGGVQSNAQTSAIFVIRGTSSQPKLYLLNARSPSNLLLAEKFKLYPNDIIYVPTTGLSNWNRVISNVLPTLTTAETAAIAG